MKKNILIILLIVVIAAVSLFVIRFFFGGPEDAWICVEGQWTKHGNPSSPAPETECGGAKTLNCKSYNADNCPTQCSVCPPCPECSSISCQEISFCESLGFDKDWYENIKKQNAAVTICQEAGGKWLGEFSECEYIGEEFCDQIGGTFFSCESACRHDDDADICTMQCVPVCKISSEKNEITSFQDCVNARNPVMESYPRQCNADGKNFTEEIGNELEKMDLIQIYNPRPNQKITSPLEIEGKARGTWFFEASFPIVLTNWDGLIIGQGIASAKDDWMTENFVEFNATIEFEKPDTQVSDRGNLILKKDNPSGLPENDDALEIPIFFE